MLREFEPKVQIPVHFSETPVERSSTCEIDVAGIEG